MPLRYLVLDMNSYFASVEQQLRPELRHRPVAVVPVLAETTCCIAASYEAKRFDVKTGTKVYEARRRCPDLRIVEARPELYITFHRQIIEAVESCLPVDKVMSIDEMICKLVGDDRQPKRAMQLGEQVKTTIRERVGRHLLCSVGVAPNRLLAKMAADMQKPDGLTLLHSEDLPMRMYELQLNDFPGVGPRMERRLHQAGITKVEQLYQLSPQHLSRIWGSKIVADRWYRLMRGEDVPEPLTRTRSIGHSHVLPPSLRNEADAKAVLTALIHKAAARLRQTAYWPGSMTITLEFEQGGHRHVCRRLPLCRDTLTLLGVFKTMWPDALEGVPLKVGVVFGDLIGGHNATPLPFSEDRRLLALSRTMDLLNAEFGSHSIYFAGMIGAEEHTPMRIAFTRVPENTV